MALRATVIVNPAARRVGADFDGSRITRYLAEHECEPSLVFPGSAEEATAAAREAASRGEDVVFVVGGDGSVRQAALGLAGSETALAAVPAGTVNVWARETGIPLSIDAAIDAHLNGQFVHMDLGRANDHCFMLMAGVGWDAEIVSRVSKRLKTATGDLAYVAGAAWMAPRLRPHPARWRTSARSYEERLAWMVLGNSRLYGGRLQVTPEAHVDDGEFDVLAACPRRLTDTLRLAAKLLRGRRADPRVLQFRAAELSVETPGLAVQLDGDYAGETPMTFRIERRALLVSVPAGPLAPVFGEEHVDRRKP